MTNQKLRPLKRILYSLLVICGIVSILVWDIPQWLIQWATVALTATFLLMFGRQGMDYFVYDITLKKLFPKVVFPLYFNVAIYLLGVVNPAVALSITSIVMLLSEAGNPYKTKTIKWNVIKVRFVAFALTFGLTVLSFYRHTPIVQNTCAYFGITTDILSLAILFISPAIQIVINFILRIVKEEFNPEDFFMLSGLVLLALLLPAYLHAGEWKVFLKLALPMCVALFKDGDIPKNAKDLPYVFINGVFGETLPALCFPSDLGQKCVSKTSSDVTNIIRHIVTFVKYNIELGKQDIYRYTVDIYCTGIVIDTFTDMRSVPFDWKALYTWDYQKLQKYQI